MGCTPTMRTTCGRSPTRRSSQAKLSVGYTKTREESIAHQRLALGQALCRGMSYWWTELTEWIGPYKSNFSDPELLAEMQRHQELFERWTRNGHDRSVAQIALVIDEEAIAVLGLESKFFLKEVYEQLPSWGWCGAPFDVWLASDVTAENMGRYRLAYVFAPFLSDASRETLRRALCNSGRTVWWSPYTGWLTERGTDAGEFEKLTGFAEPTPTPGMPRARRFGEWVSLYGPCSGIGPEQLSMVATKAGVHSYGDPPIQVLASERFVCVHVRRAGRYALHLPGTGEWFDLLGGQSIDNAAIDFPGAGVVLLSRGDRIEACPVRSA